MEKKCDFCQRSSGSRHAIFVRDREREVEKKVTRLLLCVACAGRACRTGKLDKSVNNKIQFIDKEPSDYLGVVYCSSKNCWQCEVEIDGVATCLGSGKTAIMAAYRVRQKVTQYQNQGKTFNKGYGNLILDDGSVILESSDDETGGSSKSGRKNNQKKRKAAFPPPPGLRKKRKRKREKDEKRGPLDEIFKLFEALDEPMKKLIHQHEAREKAFEDLNKKLQKAEEENARYSKIVSATKRLINRTGKEKKELKAKVIELAKSMEGLKMELQAAQKKISEKEKEKAQSLERSNQLETEVEELKEKVLMLKKNSKPTILSNPSINGFSNQELKHQEELLSQLVQEIERARKRISAQKKECPICLDKAKNCILNPCGHGYCFSCAKQIESCAFCETKKQSIIKVFW